MCIFEGFYSPFLLVVLVHLGGRWKWVRAIRSPVSGYASSAAVLVSSLLGFSFRLSQAERLLRWDRLPASCKATRSKASAQGLTGTGTRGPHWLCDDVRHGT